MAGAHHGGAEAFFTRLTVGLQRAGQEQRVVIRRDPERATSLRLGGVEPVQFRFGGPLDLVTKIGLRRVIADYNPDIVLTWMNRATRFCPRGKFIHVARLGGYYDLKYYKNCDQLIGNTQDIVDYLVRQGWPSGRAHYLPNFVSITSASPQSRAALETPENAPLAVALGRLHPNKAFDVLLMAMSQVPHLHLWLAGEGELQTSLEEQAMALGVRQRVHFLGWRQDISALLAAADFLVCPSRYEPLGNVVIEAWAARKPVIAASSAGPLSLIRDNETGLLVPIDNADALALAMKRLIEDHTLMAELVENGYRAYRNQFSEEHVIKLYRDFFALVGH